MSGVSKIEIHEDSATLLSLMKQQKQLSKHERVQALYLLKSGEAKSIAQVSRILGHNRITVQRWLCEYRQGGLEYLLSPRAHGGRAHSIPPAVQAELRQRLKQPRGFVKYQDIVTWLATEYGIAVNYWVVYDLVRRRWKAKLKRPRPSHALQNPQALEDFPKQLAHRLSLAVGVAPDLNLRYWVEDESRFGLKPITRRRITAKGVAPVALQYWRFEWVWLYGLVEPLTGESCFWEFSHLDHDCFGQVLQLFAQQYPNDMHVIQLDRSAVHRTPKLDKPNNVAFLFQPAYSPELNPIEQLWSMLKAKLSNHYWFDLDELQQALSHQIHQLTRAGLRSLTQRDFLMEAFELAGIRPKQLVYP